MCTIFYFATDSLYETLSFFGTNPRVKELHSPYLFDIDRLDGLKLLDATWDLFPAIEPKIMNKLDGSWLLDGTEPLEAYNIRRLALLITIDTSPEYEYFKIPKEISKLLAAITVYYIFSVWVNLGLEVGAIETCLDGSFLLDGTRLLTTEIEAVFYNGLTELYRVPVTVSEETFPCLRIITQKRNYTITRCEILRSSELIGEFDLQINTNVYLQYEFIVT